MWDIKDIQCPEVLAYESLLMHCYQSCLVMLIVVSSVIYLNTIEVEFEKMLLFGCCNPIESPFIFLLSPELLLERPKSVLPRVFPLALIKFTKCMTKYDDSNLYKY